MDKIIVSHPLVKHKLSVLRDENTKTAHFRATTNELVALLSYEGTSDIRIVEKNIKTPVAQTIGYSLGLPLPIIVPILRAGLGMLEGVLSVLPDSPVGFLGMKRDENTLKIETYAKRLPKRLDNIPTILVDPMLATGNSMVDAIKFLSEKNTKKITIINILSAPQGISAIEKLSNEIDIPIKLVTASIDEKLNDKAYIVPGLGDAGDRLYGDPGD
jgi:uracil phosphoribosyltransferase